MALSPKHHRTSQNVFLTTEFGLQVLRNGFDQTWRHRRFEAEGGHTEGGRRHLYIQEGEPDDVRMGDQGSVTVGDGVWPGERAKCQLNQQVGWDQL